MTSKVTPGEKNQVILEIEMPGEELTKEYGLALKKLSGKANIPGFRKGKVPPAVLESFASVEAILNEAAEAMIPKGYFEAVKENDLKPVDNPNVEILQLGKNQPLIFKATVTVEPEVKLGEYSGLTVKKPARNFSEEEIDEALEQKRLRLAKWSESPVEGVALAKGDMANFDFSGLKDGFAFPGGTATDYSLEIGSGRFIPGFEEQMIGMVSGEERTLNLTFPEDYQESFLAGEEVQFIVKLNYVKPRELPELNDAFAQEVSETADTLAQLRQEIAAQLDATFVEQADRQWRNQLVIDIIENAEVDIPPIMIEHRIDNLIEEFAHNLEQQGLELKHYLEYIDGTEESLREQYFDQAEKGVRIDLVMEAIADAENIEATEEDIDREIAKVANNSQQTPSVLRHRIENSGNLPGLIKAIKITKAVDFVSDKAIIMEDGDQEGSVIEGSIIEGSIIEGSIDEDQIIEGQISEEIIAEESEAKE